MILRNAEYQSLIYDVRAWYIALRLEKRRAKKRLDEIENKIKDMEIRYKIKK